MTGSVFLLFLAASFAQGYGFVVDSKLSLPPPPGADSSLSPKLIRAFYEINFIPVDSEGVENKFGEATVVLEDADCQLTPALCKRSKFITSKVKTVQKVDDMIHGALASGDVPVVKGYSASETQVSDLMNEINRMTNKVVPLKGTQRNATKSQTEVPVYKGIVDTQAVLDRGGKPEVVFRRPPTPPTRQPNYNTARPYHPPGRPYYDIWSRRGPPPCVTGQCHHHTWQMHHQIQIASRM